MGSRRSRAVDTSIEVVPLFLSDLRFSPHLVGVFLHFREGQKRQMLAFFSGLVL